MKTLSKQRGFQGTAPACVSLVALGLLLGACAQPGGTNKPERYTIAFESHGGSAVADITAEEGTELEQPEDPVREGYAFTGWFSAETEGTLYDWPHILAADITMHAQWQENAPPPPAQYTLAFDSHGGSAVEAITAEEGTEFERPDDPAREGYAFAGWFSAAEGGAEYSWPHTLSADLTMHARWQENAAPPPALCTLAFDSHGGSAVADMTAEEGTELERPDDPVREGYAFIGWFSSAEEGTLYAWPHALAGDLTMHARWRENAAPPPTRYTLSFDSHGGSEVADITAEEGTALEKPGDPARANYVFTGWFSSAEGGALYEWPYTLTGDVIMHARWQENAKHTLAFDSHGGSTVQPITAYEGAAVDKPADPAREGYAFAGWFSTAEGGSEYPWPHVLTGNTTAHAHWKHSVPFAISVWANRDGAILDSNEALRISKTNSGDNPDSFTVAVAGGYTLDRWSLDGSPLSGDEQSVSIDAAAQSITINAAGRSNGSYILGARASKDGIPYSAEIRFTVAE
jgi:uncharacterized repeat protein (TIGR02543 family)